jgi:endonuclease/exonuclease/phosphatase family metal-dependent hydrolase
MKGIRSHVVLMAFLIASGATRQTCRSDELPERITIATWNLEWFFDHYTDDNLFDVPKQQSPPSRDEWEWKLSVTAAAIAQLNPTILCLQEVESRATVAKLAKRLREEHRLDYRVAFVEGTDVFTEQDVCVLARSGLVEFGRKEQSQEMFKSQEFYNLQKHIFCRFEWGEGRDKLRLTLLNLHMRAQPERTDIRIRQARLAHRWLAEQIAAGENVVLLGDSNTNFAFEETTPETDIGILRGQHTDTVDDDLFDCHALLRPEERATHLVRKAFDRILISPSMQAGNAAGGRLVLKSCANRQDVNTRGEQPDDDHWNRYYQIPQAERDVSDHYPLVAEFEVK